MNVNTEVFDRSVERGIAVSKFENGMVRKVVVASDARRDTAFGLFKGRALKKRDAAPFMKDFRAMQMESFKNINTSSERSLIDLIGNQLSFQAQSFETGVGEIWRINQPNRQIARDIVLRRPIFKERTLLEGWGDIAGIERKRTEGIIRAGLHDGWSMERMALEVRRKNPFKISKEQSKSLTTTAVTSVSAQADHAVFMANKESLRGWEYVALLDGKTTDICIHRDGQIYPVDDFTHLPPAHYRCRSVPMPVFKSWDGFVKLEGVAQVRRRNLLKLTPERVMLLDGVLAKKEHYNDWLTRQPFATKLRHLKDPKRVALFEAGKLPLKKFTDFEGNLVGITELRKLTDVVTPGDTARFALAKIKLDSLAIGASRIEDFLDDPVLTKNLKEYYLLQAGELDGTLSLTNYRGILLSTKSNNRRRVLNSLPTEKQAIYNPITHRYDDSRRYQPNAALLLNRMRQIETSPDLLDKDKAFITSFIKSLDGSMSMNERSVVADNLRILFVRQRKSGEGWTNFKAVANSQIKFDVINVSDTIENTLRKDGAFLRRLKLDNYIDPILGEIQLDDIHDNFLKNIFAKNKWEDRVVPKIAREMRPIFDSRIPLFVWSRLKRSDVDRFYMRLAHKLSMDAGPDRDQFAIELGRMLYNTANLNGTKQQWFTVGKSMLEAPAAKKLFTLDTFGVQKRRLKSRTGGKYFGPYYDTLSFNLRLTDPRLIEYSRLTRAIELGLRVSPTSDKNRLLIRPGFKTYFTKRAGFLYDTRIPITSSTSFYDFPVELVDKDLSRALNWTANAKYKIDPDFHSFVTTLLDFRDDKGRAAYFEDVNFFKKYLVSRGDSYERFKAMEWLRKKDASFSNNPFVDHRLRIYDRGLIGPQSGETFRPFLNTAKPEVLGREGYDTLRDQVGSFLGGMDAFFEGTSNSLTTSGRREIYDRLRPQLVEIGNLMLRGKPDDIRKILSSSVVQRVDPEELAKFYRFALEMAKVDNFLSTTVHKPFLEQRGFFQDGVWWGNGLALFDLNPLLVAARTRPVTNLAADKIFITPRETMARIDRGTFGVDFDAKVASADVSKPILVTKHPQGLDGYQIVDGNHRAFKLLAQQPPPAKLRVIEIPASVLDSAELDLSKVRTSFWIGAFDMDDIRAQLKSGEKYSDFNLKQLDHYYTSLALEQDASSSGAQIIAITTKNKQLAALSNVIQTKQKQRLYDEIAASTFRDPRFIELNKKLGLNERDLRKAAKAANMVTFYGAGERTAALNVEGKLAKILDIDGNLLVIRATERDQVLDQISARAARFKMHDPDTHKELQILRRRVKDTFDRGQDPGDDILEQLWFLDPETRTLVDKLSSQHERVVTPTDFKQVARIMSDLLAEQAPIAKTFTQFMGKLSQEYFENAKPAKSNFSFKSIAKSQVFGNKEKGFTLPDRVSEILGIKAGEPLSEKFLKGIGVWAPGNNLDILINGAELPGARRSGTTVFKLKLLGKKVIDGVEIFKDNKLPKKWTNAPWVNFDGKVIEQNFTQTFEERLTYKDADGNFVKNVLQIPQKTEATWWEQYVLNEGGHINDIVDITKARTAFAVNGNHSNDAVFVKQLHLWGADAGIETSTVHDAFFHNIAHMITARKGLRQIYADALPKNVIKKTLDEMRARGMPYAVYKRNLDEAIELGLIPVAGRSRINGKLLTEDDILKESDILEGLQDPPYENDTAWYGIG